MITFDDDGWQSGGPGVATILWGHGERDRGEEKTFVPQGVTVKWWAEIDHDMLTNNGFAAIETGAFSTPTDQMGPGDETKIQIYNYRVFADPRRQEEMSLVSLLHKDGRHALKFVGVDVDDGHLCNDVAGCIERGSHTCDGVLGKATVEWRDPELVLLHCRGIAGKPLTPTVKFGRNEGDPLSDLSEDLTMAVDNLISQVLADPEAAEKEYDSFPDRSKIYAATDRKISGWLAVRWAADYGRKGEIPDLFKQLDDQLENKLAEPFLDVSRYEEGLFAAAESKPAEFFAMLDKLLERGRGQGILAPEKQLPNVLGRTPRTRRRRRNSTRVGLPTMASKKKPSGGTIRSCRS